MSKIWDKVKDVVCWSNIFSRKNKLLLLILVSGLLIVFGAGSSTTKQITMSPEFCSMCHEMNPEVTTWRATSHSNVPCSECHTDTVNNKYLSTKLGAVREMILHVTNGYDKPIKLRKSIKDTACNKCHNVNTREFTLSGDLIIPHDRHGKKGISCIQCHSGVVHGDIASRGVTADTDLSKWTEAMGRQNTESKFVRPKMNVCMDCHETRSVTNACEACHTSVFVPDNHKAKDWTKVHGNLARKDLGYCNKCHSYSLEGKDGAKKTISEYARGNVYCYTCHMQLPAGHTADWKIIHKKEAVGDKEGCLVCHDDAQPKTTDKATKTYCAQCHQRLVIPGTEGSTKANGESKGQSQGQADTNPGTHPGNWRKLHPKVIKEIGTSGGKCFSCHDSSNCFKCHTNGGKT